jgi:hypothetical protein
VTPSILKFFARAEAASYNQPMCSGSSVSIFLSVVQIVQDVKTLRIILYTNQHVREATLEPKPILYSVRVDEECLRWCILGMQWAY